MLFVQLGINNARNVWKFCQIGLAPAAPILISVNKVEVWIETCVNGRGMEFTTT